MSPVFRRESEYTNLKNNSASTLVCVLMINAQGIMLSVQGQVSTPKSSTTVTVTDVTM